MKDTSTKKFIKTGLNRIMVVVLLTVVSIASFLILQNQKSKVSPQNQISPKVEKLETDNFFKSPKDLHVRRIKVDQLPDSEGIQGFETYKNSLWVSGDGALIEYDLNLGKVIGFSDPLKANCDSNLVIVNDYLFAACRTPTRKYIGKYLVLKINLKNLKVEKIFSEKDGLLDQNNYDLFKDGNYVWVSTYDGLGKVNAKTDEVDFYRGELEEEYRKRLVWKYYTKEDEKGFIQIYSADGKLKHKIDGRAFLWMSNLQMNNKRYFVTSASIDILESGGFPKTILEIGRSINGEDVKFYSGGDDMAFIVDPHFFKGGPVPPQWGTMTIWVLDLTKNKLLTKFTSNEKYTWRRNMIYGNLKFFNSYAGDFQKSKMYLFNEEGQNIFVYDKNTNSITILDTNLAN